MELLQLKYFQIVAKYEHITKAAEELHISQPSLSKVISRLEEELGVPLFDRMGRNIKLNSFGNVFLKRADRVFLELENGKRELSDMFGLEEGRISVALTSLSLFPRVLEEFLSKYPHVRFRQIIASTAEIKRSLKEGVIDICVTSPPIEGPGIVCTPLVTEEILLAVPKGHKFSGRESINLSEAANESFIGLKQGYGFRDITDEFCHKAGFEPNIVFEGDVAGSSLSLVNAGLGITFFPNPNTREFSVQLPELIHIKNPICERTISLAYLESHYLSKAAQEFCRHLVSHFSNHESK